MAPKNNPTGQHDLPQTYLKRFSIDPNNREKRKIVYCFWKSQFETKIKEVSIDANKFKKGDFYTINHTTEPYLFEEAFSREIEPLYNVIIKEVEQESNLSSECRQYLIVWLFINKYRNEAFRSIIEKVINLSSQSHYRIKNGNDKYKLVKEELENISKAKAKEIHLKSIIKDELMKEFEKGIGTKHWIILKSRPSNEFLTNDNPGFSINIDYAKADLKTLSSFYATNSQASNYFVLSPKYCLLISPFWQGTPLNTSINNQEIECKTTNDVHIDFINYCTTKTRTKYLISNNKNLIIKHTQK